jgi:hypothetical protein
MGAHFKEAEFDGNLTKAELTVQYNALVEEERYEYGSGAYSGTFATLHGIQILDKVFNSRNEASDHISENTDKRGAALAVKFRDTREVLTSSPTFNGKKLGAYPGVHTVSLDPNDLFRTFGAKGAKCIASDTDGSVCKFVLADQLSETQKASLKAVLDPCAEENKKFNALSKDLKALLLKAGDLNTDFTTEDHKSLKATRKELLKTKIKRDKLLVKLQTLDEKFGSKLYKKATEDHGCKWIVGGWCAS